MEISSIASWGPRARARCPRDSRRDPSPSLRAGCRRYFCSQPQRRCTLTPEAAVPIRLSHHRGVLGLDFIHHTNFAGLRVGILVYAQIFLGQLVDVVVRAVFRDLDDAATNLDIAV